MLKGASEDQREEHIFLIGYPNSKAVLSPLKMLNYLDIQKKHNR